MYKCTVSLSYDNYRGPCPFYPSNSFGCNFHDCFLFVLKFDMKSHNANMKLSYFIQQCPKKCLKYFLRVDLNLLYFA